MTWRPVFIPQRWPAQPVRVLPVEFTWSPGLALSQHRRNIAAMHDSARVALGSAKVLEISTRSPDAVGCALSAFNLTFKHPDCGTTCTVESAYQAAKVFRDGGPFPDILSATPSMAKRDPRLLAAGDLVGFQVLGAVRPVSPTSEVYDWLYLQGLLQSPALLDRATGYAGFTDIAFNPLKSFNCQAAALALAVALHADGVALDLLDSPEALARCVADSPGAAAPPRQAQMSLL